MTALWIFLGIVVLAFLFVIGIYNSLIGAKNQVKNSWSQIDVQLKRRHDLIPNLLESVKGYMQHERGTLEAVTTARSAWQNANTVGQQIEAHHQQI